MEKLKAKRRTLRRQSTIIIKEATTALEGTDTVQLSALLQRLEVNNSELRKVNTELEQCLPDDIFEDDYAESVQYDDRVNNTIGLLRAKIAAPVATIGSTSNGQTTEPVHATPVPVQQRGIKLPKLHMETFSGELSSWQEFWECFKQAVHDNDGLSKSQKFQYLRSLLTGAAMTSIKGLQATEACYDDAIDILQRRYGDKERIQQDHLGKLRALPRVSSSADVRGLRRLFDHIQMHIRGLRGLGVCASTYSAMLCDIILSSLPQDMIVEFHRQTSRASKPNESTDQSEGRESSSPSVMAAGGDGKLSEILDFLLVETESRERCMDMARSPMESSKQKQTRQENYDRCQPPRRPSAAVLHTRSERVRRCFFCESGEHDTEACTAPVPLKEKLAKMGQAGRCFRCTIGGHQSKQCTRKVKCVHCNKRHASSVCNPDWRSTEPKEVLATNVHAASREGKDEEVALQTFRTWAIGESRWGYVRGVIDGGSQRTFIREDVSKVLKLRTLGTIDFHLNTFGSTEAHIQSRRVVELRVWSGCTGKETIEAVEVPFICKDVLPVPVEHAFVQQLEKEGAVIADKLLHEDMPAVPGIGLLIGADHLWKFLTGEVRRCEVNQGLAAINTTFGWTFQGPFSANTSFVVTANVCVLRIGLDTTDNVETALQKFWELDAIGISEKSHNHKIEHSDIAKITKKAARYQVALPWKKESTDLADNRDIAVQRLKKKIDKALVP